jgi:hypothetical protein
MKEALTIILSIGVPMLAGFGWIIIQLFKMQKDISGTKIEIANTKVEIIKEIRGLDSRISHIEGYLIGYNQKTGPDNGRERK